MSKYIKFCPHCNETGLNASKILDDNEFIDFYKGFLFLNKIEDENSNICPCCKNVGLLDSVLTEDEFVIIQKCTQNRQVLESMIELKKSNIIDFELKLNQFKLQQEQAENIKEQQRESSKPKCPHCHSTNIKSISGLNRSASIAMWGIFSKKINKSFECKECGYTW